jgi:hypothetical protein
MVRLPVLFLAFIPSALPQSASLPSKETLTYNVEWRLITAGKATVQWLSVPQHDRPGWQVNLHLESVGLVSKLFKVEDDYSANLNQPLCVQSTVMTSREGTRHHETKVIFDAETRKASYVERDLAKNTVLASQETDIPECVHDVIAGIYFLRTLNLEPGQSTEVPVSDGKKVVMARVEAQQREDVKVPDATYKTIRYEVFLFNNVLYRRSAHLHVWLSDDRRKLPVQVRVRLQVTIGTITLQLEKRE